MTIAAPIEDRGCPAVAIVSSSEAGVVDKLPKSETAPLMRVVSDANFTLHTAATEDEESASSSGDASGTSDGNKESSSPQSDNAHKSHINDSGKNDTPEDSGDSSNGQATIAEQTSVLQDQVPERLDEFDRSTEAKIQSENEKIADLKKSNLCAAEDSVETPPKEAVDSSSSQNSCHEGGQDLSETSSVSSRYATTEAIARRRRSSIKEFNPSQVPVLDKRSVWRQLRKPDLRNIRASSAPLPTSDRPSRDLNVPRRVRFHEIQVRSYEQTIGDNPCVSYGPPISLDWDFTELEAVDLEEYEANRGRRRGMREMMMNYYLRKNLLTFKYGATEAELKAATRAANREKRSRALTKALLPASMFEDFAQSAIRKTKRLTKGKTRSTSLGDFHSVSSS